MSETKVSLVSGDLSKPAFKETEVMAKAGLDKGAVVIIAARLEGFFFFGLEPWSKYDYGVVLFLS